MRATSIDELPQLINVLRGHMSLVGPRPHAVAHDDGYTKLIAKYAFRQHVKPGLTGWAQVNGFRGETAQLELMERRVDCDLWYIKNWSFWLDLRILVLTCFELLRGEMPIEPNSTSLDRTNRLEGSAASPCGCGRSTATSSEHLQCTSSGRSASYPLITHRHSDSQ